MQLAKTTTYKIEFQVQAFMGTEGGMDHNTHGDPVPTLEAALENLEIAEAIERANSRGRGPMTPWIIVVLVDKKVVGKVQPA